MTSGVPASTDLVVAHQNLDDAARYFRRDLRHVGLDVGVLGADGAAAVQPYRAADQHDNERNQHEQHQAHDLRMRAGHGTSSPANSAGGRDRLGRIGFEHRLQLSL